MSGQQQGDSYRKASPQPALIKGPQPTLQVALTTRRGEDSRPTDLGLVSIKGWEGKGDCSVWGHHSELIDHREWPEYVCKAWPCVGVRENKEFPVSLLLFGSPRYWACERSRNTLITMIHPGPESPGLVETQENTKIQLRSVKAEVEVAPGGKRNHLKCLGQFPRRDTLQLGSEG